jgi:hypothetical protein
VTIEAYCSRNETKDYVNFSDLCGKYITLSNPKSHYTHLKTLINNKNKRKILHKNCKHCKQIREVLQKRKFRKKANYHSVQNLPASRLFSRKLKIKMYKTIILPVVLYGCET